MLERPSLKSFPSARKTLSVNNGDARVPCRHSRDPLPDDAHSKILYLSFFFHKESQGTKRFFHDKLVWGRSAGRSPRRIKVVDQIEIDVQANSSFMSICSLYVHFSKPPNSILKSSLVCCREWRHAFCGFQFKMTVAQPDLQI